MKRVSSFIGGVLVLIAMAVPTISQDSQERSLSDALAAIRDEGLKHSQVMTITSFLTDGSGPRLTNSPNIKASAQWVLGKMNDWGLSNPNLETWGPFGRGWSNEHFEAAMVKPYRFPLIGNTKPWTPGTNGLLTGEVAIYLLSKNVICISKQQ